MNYLIEDVESISHDISDEDFEDSLRLSNGKITSQIGQIQKKCIMLFPSEM